MPRKAPIPKCSQQDKKMLRQLAGNRTGESRLVERAKIILECLQRERVLSLCSDFIFPVVGRWKTNQECKVRFMMERA